MISWERGHGGMISGACWAESLLIPLHGTSPPCVDPLRPASPPLIPNTRFFILADGFLYKQWVRCGVVVAGFFL